MKPLAAALLALAALLTGCSTPSLNPLASPEVVVTDDGLAGVWRPQKDGKDTEEAYTIAAGAEKSYVLTLSKPDEKDMTFSLHVVRLGDHHFVDLTVTAKDREEMGERWGTAAAPMHNIIKINREGDTLRIWPLDDNYLKESLKGGSLTLDHATHGKDKAVVITASTSDLQAFFRKHADSKDLWDEGGTLKRTPTAKPSK